MAKCNKCGLEIRFTKKDGRWLVHNPDGSDHWDACSKARVDAIKSRGTFFVSDRTQGYKLPDGGVFITQTSRRVVGEDFHLSGDCADCCEPWEVCTWPCPDRI